MKSDRTANSLTARHDEFNRFSLSFFLLLSKSAFGQTGSMYSPTGPQLSDSFLKLVYFPLYQFYVLSLFFFFFEHKLYSDSMKLKLNITLVKLIDTY